MSKEDLEQQTVPPIHLKQPLTHSDLGFRHEADDNTAPLGYYTANSGNFVPTFRDDISVPSSRVNNFLSSPKRR
jgi:hypothetical protein